MLTGGPIGRVLLELALPILWASILQCAGGTVTVFWVGRCLGETALTAVANAQSMMILLTGVAFGITTSATVLVGQCLGAHDVPAAKRVVATGVMLFSAMSIVLTLLGIAFATPLLIAMRTVPEALPLAVPYMRVMLLALPGTYFLAFVMSLLVATGDSRTPLGFILLSVILGALFTPAFMFGGDIVPGGRLIGAALATLIAQSLCLAALLRHLYRRSHPLHLTRQDVLMFRVNWSIVRELVRMGIPMGAQILVISLSSVLMITLVNRFGVATTAAYGALIQLWTYIAMPAIAMATAVSTMAAQNVGAQKWDRVNQIALVGVGYSCLATIILVAAVYVADSYAYRLFLPDGSAGVLIASHVSRIATWSLILMSIALVLFGVMRAAGTVMVPLLVHILSLLVVRYPLAALLVERWQSDAIWWSFTISAGVDVVLAVLYYRFGQWHRVGRSHVDSTAPTLKVSMHSSDMTRPGDEQRDDLSKG